MAVSAQLPLLDDAEQFADQHAERGTTEAGSAVETRVVRRYTSVEICAGAGGAALGIEQAGFAHLALVEIDGAACATLRLNRPGWQVIEEDVRRFDGWPYLGIDLLSGGVPCPPFSKAGH